MCCRSQSLSYIASGGECLLCNLKAHVFGRMIVAYNRGEEFFHTTLTRFTRRLQLQACSSVAAW